MQIIFLHPTIYLVETHTQYLCRGTVVAETVPLIYNLQALEVNKLLL